MEDIYDAQELEEEKEAELERMRQQDEFEEDMQYELEYSLMVNAVYAAPFYYAHREENQFTYTLNTTYDQDDLAPTHSHWDAHPISSPEEGPKIHILNFGYDQPDQHWNRPAANTPEYRMASGF
ncbi:MAG: hypothetical protein DHS20C02_17400 [Micavibrio sp.]|nr:MAG: hypothetical protein DHS20C02_17400 [Micavibrio sp.]